MALMEPIELRLATLERLPSGVLIVRFRPGRHLDNAGVAEVIEARYRASVQQGAAVMVVLHEENLSDMEVNITDHGLRVAPVTIAEATVALSTAEQRLAELYYTHHVQPFPTAVFRNEAEAIEWLQPFAHSTVKP
jgi:hypothetical protein